MTECHCCRTGPGAWYSFAARSSGSHQECLQDLTMQCCWPPVIRCRGGTPGTQSLSLQMASIADEVQPSMWPFVPRYSRRQPCTLSATLKSKKPESKQSLPRYSLVRVQRYALTRFGLVTCDWVSKRWSQANGI